VWIEEMTWLDVRDALAAGKTTVIIPAGGIEPNGPWVALGKHNYIARPLCEAIARKLGNALCAPVIPFVPEGDIDAKTAHMKSPGTIGVREETYEALLTDLAHTVKGHGFQNIILIGDHGGDEDGMKAVAAKLQDAWKFSPAVYYIPEYYKSWDGAVDLLYKKGLGKAGVTDGLHDDPTVTGLMMITDPKTVRWKDREGDHRRCLDREQGKDVAMGSRTLGIPGTGNGGSHYQDDRRKAKSLGRDVSDQPNSHAARPIIHAEVVAVAGSHKVGSREPGAPAKLALGAISVRAR
jgi:creatinine amidohydrolase/Fe(II)-dependent formamide hydrolase-like protein